MVSQTVIPGLGKLGGAAPMAFTEQGVAMLSSVLRSPRAVQVNIAIMRAFVRLREMLLTNADLARKLADLEQKYDTQFKVVFDAIRQLMAPPPAPPNRKSASMSKKTPFLTAPRGASNPAPHSALRSAQPDRSGLGPRRFAACNAGAGVVHDTV
jgi:hypothetical protein